MVNIRKRTYPLIRMSDFIPVLPLAAPLDRDSLRRLAIHACLELHRVRWLRSYVASDGSRMLCWYMREGRQVLLDDAVGTVSSDRWRR